MTGAVPRNAGKQKRRARAGGRRKPVTPKPEPAAVKPPTVETTPEVEPGSLSRALRELSLDDLIAIGAATAGAVEPREPK